VNYIEEAVAAEPKRSYADVAFAETVDDARFLAMRLTRYVVSWVCWAAMCASTALACVTPLVHWYGSTGCIAWMEVPAIPHPFLTFGFFVVSTVINFCLYVAIATPYRYITTKPGLNVRTCARCGVQGPDLWYCGNCDSFRIYKVFTSIIWLLGALLTTVTIILDIVLFIVGFKSMGSK
jgi:hypothetical protein